MSDLVGSVIKYSKTQGAVRALLMTVAYYVEWHEGQPPTRGQLASMVNESRRQCDKLIDYAVQAGELIVNPSEHDADGHDEIDLNYSVLSGGAK